MKVRHASAHPRDVGWASRTGTRKRRLLEPDLPTSAKVVASGGADIATLNISPSIPDDKTLVQGSDAVQFMDFVPAFGTAPTNYKGVALTELKDGYLLEFKRGNLSNTTRNALASFAVTGDVVTITKSVHGLDANAFVDISGASAGTTACSK